MVLSCPVEEAWREAWSAPDRRPIYFWAADHVTLPKSSGYTVSGKFDISFSPQLMAILDALQDDLCRKVTLAKPIRGGGTLVADVLVPWLVVNDAGPTMWNMQTDSIAKDHAENRAKPVLLLCPPVAELFPVNRHLNRAQQILFPHMPLYIQGPAIGNLQSKGIRWLINDEVWLWKKGRLAEAEGRTLDFAEIGQSHIFNVSQGSCEEDDFAKDWEAGTQEVFNVRCLKCGALQPCLFEGFRADGSRWGMVWEDSAVTRQGNGEWDFNAVERAARFECRDCRHQHLDNQSTRVEFRRHGCYVALNPGAGPRHRSFRFNFLLIRQWGRVVVKFLKAMAMLKRGVDTALREFVQKELAETWKVNWGLADKAPAVLEVSSDHTWDFKFLTVDVQKDFAKFYCIARGWMRNADSHRLARRQLITWEQIRELQLELGIKDQHVFVDVGYEMTQVCKQLVKYGHFGSIAGQRRWLCWQGLWGRDVYDFAHNESTKKTQRTVRRLFSPLRYADPYIGQKRTTVNRAPYWMWSNRQVKDILKRLRDGKGAKYTAPKIDPTDLAEVKEEAIYVAHNNAEILARFVDKKTNREVEKWIKKKQGIDNHYGDAEGMQIVPVSMFGILGFGTPDAAEISAEVLAEVEVRPPN